MAEQPRIHVGAGQGDAQPADPPAALSRFARVAPAGPERESTVPAETRPRHVGTGDQQVEPQSQEPVQEPEQEPNPAAAREAIVSGETGAAPDPAPEAERSTAPPSAAATAAEPIPTPVEASEPQPAEESPSTTEGAIASDRDAAAAQDSGSAHVPRPTRGTEQAPPPPDAAAEPEVVSQLPRELRHERTHDAEGHSAALVALREEGGSEASRREKVPFWKRIHLPRSLTPPGTPSPAPRAASLEPVLSRLNALEKQLAANQSATETRLERFEENITRLWEIEEQMALTEVRERLALFEANQEEIADDLHAVRRNVSILAVVLAIAVAAVLLGLGIGL